MSLRSAVVLVFLFPASLCKSQELDHSRLPGTTWRCEAGGKLLGTLTFQPGGVLDVSWQDNGTWTPTPGGVHVLGVAVSYQNKTFTGVSGSGVPIVLTHQEEAPATGSAKPQEVAAAFDARSLGEVETLKILRDSDHRFSLQGKTTASGRSTQINWQTSWGSYDKDFERSATVEFSVRHLGRERECFLEVAFLARDSSGNRRYAYSFDSVRMKVVGDETRKFDAFLKSNDTQYRSLGVRIQSGSKPDGWIAWVRDGGDIMALTASRGAIVDSYKTAPNELLAMAKSALDQK